MKKCKMFTMLLSMLLISCMLSACSISKDKDPGGQSDSGEELVLGDKITTMNGLVFNTGDTITFDDLASLSAEDDGNALQKVIVLSDGSVVGSYTLTETGTFSVVVAVQLIDGTSKTADCVIEVVEKETTLPDELHNNVASKEWTVSHLTEYAGIAGQYNFEFRDGSTALSYTSDMRDKIDIDLGGFSTSSDYKIKVSYMPGSAYNQFLNTFRDIFKTDTSYAAIMESVLMMFGGEGDDDVYSMVLWYGQLMTDITSAVIIPTDVYLYDNEGNSYQVMAVQYKMDSTLLGGEVVTYAGPMYVDYLGGKVLFEITGGTATITSAEPITTDENEVTNYPATYEEFKALLMSTMSVNDWRSMAPNLSVDNAVSELRAVGMSLILGDVAPLLPSAPPKAEVVADPDPVEEPAETGIVAEVFVPYSSKHPEIYTWPENGTKYSRWVYIIDNSTQFVSSITNPDGTTIISGVGDNDWRVDVGGTGGQQTGTTSPGVVDEKKMTLSSAYSSYEISTAGLPGSSFDETNSTSGRAVIKKGADMYYIETVRSSQIQNYISNCLYDKSKFKDGYFRVVEDGSESTDHGTITKYVVQYTQGNNGKSSAYMAVYNINNDYLCCYGSSLPSDDSIFANILKNMVRVY